MYGEGEEDCWRFVMGKQGFSDENLAGEYLRSLLVHSPSGY